MPIFRADYHVKSTVVLSENTDTLTFDNIDPVISIVIRNAPPDKDGHAPSLNISVIGSHDKIEDVPNAFRDILARQLDILSFSTQSLFSIEECFRVTEWEPRKKDRACRVMKAFDPLYPPDPELKQNSIDTVQAIINTGISEEAESALRHFRYGILADQLTQQFECFWKSIETVAEARKNKEEVPLECPVCKNSLFCNHCQETPQRRLMANEAIKVILKIILKEKSDKAYGELSKVRHAIAHGRDLASVLKKLNRRLEDIVDDMGTIAWHAIWLLIPVKQGVDILHRNGSFAKSKRILANSFIVSYDADNEHPPEEKLLNVKMEMQTSFRPFPKTETF